MALYKLTSDVLEPIAEVTFTALGLKEKSNIQKALRRHIQAITPGAKTMVIAEEFGDWVDANRRIDLLCLDDQARLVIVELKRDNSGHMELQALRYAAMVSTMRFEQAVEAHRKYLKSIDSERDAEASIREFLQAEEGPVALSDEVRIVLAASDFSTEITTAVLWLNKQGLDIRCVQMRPHHVDGAVLLDVDQVIPLPAAAQYQVALREKTKERESVKESGRDMTRYDLTIGERTFANLPKRRLVFEIVSEAVRRGLAPEAIAAAVPWRESSMFASASGQLDEEALGRTALQGRPLDRFYAADEELFHVNGRTYALSNQWGLRTLEAVASILAVTPPGDPIEYAPTTAEASYGEYLVRRRDGGSIEVEHNGEAVATVKPVLRQLAAELKVPLQNGRGNDLNTQQLGLAVIRTIEALRE